MLFATLAIVVLMVLLLADVPFWPAVLSWVLMPFAVIHGLWWSNGLSGLSASGAIDSAVAWQILWDASILASAFFGTALIWGLFRGVIIGQNEQTIKHTLANRPGMTRGDRLGELLLASKYSSNGRR